MQSTQMALVVDALVAAFAAVPDVAVFDGQPFKLDSPDVLVVGFSAGRVAVEAVQEDADLGGGRSEALSVVCLASTLRGETEMRPVRDRAIAIVDDVQAVLRDNRDLGGVVERAVLGYEMSLDQAQTDAGASATVEFTIKVTTL